MESRSALNSSQSIIAASLFRVCLVAGDDKTPRKRVPSTSAFRRPNMVEVCGEGGWEMGSRRRNLEMVRTFVATSERVTEMDASSNDGEGKRMMSQG